MVLVDVWLLEEEIEYQEIPVKWTISKRGKKKREDFAFF